MTRTSIRLDPPAESVLSVVVRVGDPRFLSLPRGTQLADCTGCGKSVWTDPDAESRFEAEGVKIEHMCTVCFAAEHPGIVLSIRSHA